MQQFSKRMLAFALALVLALAMGAPVSMAEGAAAAKASKKPVVYIMEDYTDYPVVSFSGGVPYLQFEIRYDTKGAEGKMWVELYKGSTRIFRDKTTRLGASGSYWSVGANAWDGFALVSSKNKPLVKAGGKYKLKVYIKTKHGTSTARTFTIKIPKSDA